MIKALINTYFANYYGQGRVVEIDESHTTDSRFDLKEDGGVTTIVEAGSGFASFDNKAQCDIAVLDYEGYIDKYAGTKFHEKRLKCDCILESENSSTVILDELTSSRKGMENLTKPITRKRQYPGGKFEKVEQQLLVSLQTLNDVPEIAAYFASQAKRVCLCSYKLYTFDELEMIGNPVNVFSRGQIEAERQTGENGVIIYSPHIEALGFEYRRISHTYSYAI
ncbi:MAG: hypothetical protein IJ534_01105 [Bacteroidaceae bacterium]|nr:hypothetical protein [Bacteroidaceae bacterium]